MTPSQQSATSEERQFRLVKYFAYTSFIVLIIFSFPFSVLISRQAKEILMKNYENYALLLGQNLNYQVYQNFVVPAVMRFGAVSLVDKRQQERLDKIIKTTIHSLNIDLVNVYDIGEGVIAYSTNHRLLGKKVKDCPGYRQAIKGKESSGLISSGEDLFGLGIEGLGGEQKLRTFIAFRGIHPLTGQKSYVLGVFEIIQDLTREYQSIVRLQFLIFGLSILIMALIFVALLLIVRKAERTIGQRALRQRELESQLHHAEQLAALGQMVAGVSHEIRNPLGIIRSTAELLRGSADSDEVQKRLSGVIIEESSRLNNIVTEFLDYARPQVPKERACDLKEIIDRNLTFLEPELDRAGIHIVSHNLNGPLKIMADPDMLYRAFLNILMNAIHSLDRGGEINIGVWEERYYYVLRFEDTGSGINEEDLNRIFDPFFTTRDRGSGLGLSIVKNIIEGHEGSIWIESKEGVGTKVMVRLPRR
ncbi:MAG: ATP-binding protein [Desulfatiglans sp.]|jgi:signal transduction histidine kinase|nr:ATP-binding protein [Desulfatiglans sp.]